MMRIIIVLYFLIGWVGGKAWLAYDHGCRERQAFAEEMNEQDVDGTFYATHGHTFVVMTSEPGRADTDAQVDFLLHNREARQILVNRGFTAVECGESRGTL